MAKEIKLPFLEHSSRKVHRIVKWNLDENSLSYKTVSEKVDVVMKTK
jgi:hypothetical protein